MREHDSIYEVESKEDPWYQLLASIFTHTQRENRRRDRERKIGREKETMRDRDTERPRWTDQGTREEKEDEHMPGTEVGFFPGGVREKSSNFF